MGSTGKIMLAGNYRVQMEALYKTFGEMPFTCRDYSGPAMNFRKLYNTGFLVLVARGDGSKKVNTYRIHESVIRKLKVTP